MTHKHRKAPPHPNDQVIHMYTNSLQNRKASKPDNIPSHMLRKYAFQMPDVLLDIFNIFLGQAIVSSSLKTATIILESVSNVRSE